LEDLVMSAPLSNFSGKRVLVTGDTGFKGSWLCFWLRELQADVVGYALPPKTDEDLFNRLGLEKLIHHIKGDIRDLEGLQPVFDQFQPEFLFHLAAQSLVRLSYQEPKLTFDTNVGGSVNVLEAVRATKSLRSVIFVTSDKCYRNKEWIWGYRENDELGGHDPYSSSKAAAELVLSAYQKSFYNGHKGMGVVSVRAGNILGGGDWAQDRLVPDIIKSLRKNTPIILRHPAATRPWQHVLDPLFGYLLLASRLYASPQEFAGPFNFGPSGESIRTVHDLAEKMVNCWGGGNIRLEESPDAPYESGMLHLNCDKARRLLNWRPRWDFDRTIEETVSWYKKVESGEPAVIVTKQQIINYMEDNND
jgi:CDP-glucose 4,6-dehydratase